VFRQGRRAPLRPRVRSTATCDRRLSSRLERQPPSAIPCVHHTHSFERRLLPDLDTAPRPLMSDAGAAMRCRNKTRPIIRRTARAARGRPGWRLADHPVPALRDHHRPARRGGRRSCSPGRTSPGSSQRSNYPIPPMRSGTSSPTAPANVPSTRPNLIALARTQPEAVPVIDQLEEGRSQIFGELVARPPEPSDYGPGCRPQGRSTCSSL